MGLFGQIAMPRPPQEEEPSPGGGFTMPAFVDPSSSSEERRRAFVGLLPEWMRPRGPRGEAERQEAGAAAGAAKARAVAKETSSIPSTSEAGAGPTGVDLYPPRAIYDQPTPTLADQLGPAPEAAVEAQRARPTSGVRAFRVGGRIIYTNLPGQYEGQGREEGLSEAGAEKRAEVATYSAPPSIPMGPGNFEGLERQALVSRAREASRGGPGTATALELKPSGVDENGLVQATPGYWNQLEGTIGENLRSVSMGQALAQARLTPRQHAELQALVKDAGNDTLSTLKYAMDVVGQMDAELVGLAQGVQTSQDPAQKARFLQRQKEIQAKRDGLVQLFSLINKQPYYGNMGAPVGAGSGDTTPGS